MTTADATRADSGRRKPNLGGAEVRAQPHAAHRGALGVAIGMARKADGCTALAAVVGYLVFTGVGDAMSPEIVGPPASGAVQALIDYGVLGGILMGLGSASPRVCSTTPSTGASPSDRPC